MSNFETQSKTKFKVAFPVSLIVTFCCVTVLLNQPLSATDFSDAKKLFNKGEYQKCLDYVSKAIDDNSYGEHWHVLKVRTQLILGKYQEALKALDAGLGDYGNSIQLRWVGIEAARFNNDVRRSQKLLEEIAENSTRSWRYRDPDNQIILAQFDLNRGVDPKDVMTDRLSPIGQNFAAAQMAIAELGFEKGDFQLAADHFKRAAALDPTNPDTFFGIAKSFAASNIEKTNEALNQALELNPAHFPSLLFVIERRIDEENYVDAEKVVGQILKVNPRHPRALAFRAVIAHLENRPLDESEYRKLALSTWKGNPEVDHWIGKKISQKYRFSEGAEYQRRALMYDKDYLPAKAQMTQDLLRLGKEAEGWQLAQEVYDKDGYNIYAHNLILLRSNISKFTTIHSDGFVIRMDPREAAIYGQRVLQLLIQAKKTLCEKYEIKVSEPIVVEIFPKQQDFAIRTFGLPGGGGYLGVCFGSVITMNSPASQGQSPTNWQSVLWHEFCHVATLQKTKNKMPRWLSEGISVYEERLADPTWGQSMNYANRKMILSDDLTPVSRLSGAFLDPKSPAHLQFAYYESSLVVQYLVEKYGIETINRILVDLEIGLTINQSLKRYTGSIKLLDKEFAEYARKLATDYAQGVDFEVPATAGALDMESLKKLIDDNPKNFPLQQQYAQQLIKAGQLDQAKTVVESLMELHPAAATPYKMMATIAREQKQIDVEQSSLETYVARQSGSFESRMRLAEIAFERSDWTQTREHAEQAVAINPLLPAAHRLLAEVGEQTTDPTIVVNSMGALLEMNPLDPADAHFRMAKALVESDQNERARIHILKSLEQAPRFRQAHQLLLKIHRRQNPLNQKDESQKESKR